MKKNYVSAQKIDAKVLVVEPNIRYKGAVNKRFSNVAFANDYQEAIGKIDNGNYEAVISTFGFDSSEGVDIGRKCLLNKIPFAILANGEQDKINEARLQVYDDSELSKLVGVTEDPLKEMLFPLIGHEKTNPDLWESAFKYAQGGMLGESTK